MTRWRGWLLLPVLIIGAATAPCPAAAPRPVEFNRDVRPILSENCFQCHGPDKNKRKANLRLDTEAGAFADLHGKHALVPGKLAQSLLYQRITAADPEEQMPPAKSGKSLTPRQVEVLRLWIEQGARWQKHWSLLPPRWPALPAVRDAAWPRNPIDAFILARLETEGLRPSSEADRLTLLRRVTLDLTGLPPTPAEVDAFIADDAPDAYEKVVDRLLASPRYGEHMASRWLDGARYADTNGYQSDGERSMWRWRDWVIDAYNANMPFDRFTVEQLAGDLLPHPTLGQRIATGFNRNHRGNGEGGIIPEEYAVEYVVDRVDTTATVWLGLTLGCARCHDHKFDPFTQRDFYRLFAFFNSVPEKGRAIKFGNSPPMMKAPTLWQQQRLTELDRALAAAEQHERRLGPEVAAAQAAWEKALDRSRPLPWSPARRLAWRAPGAERGSPAVFDGRRCLDAGDVGDFGYEDKFSLAAWVRPDAPGTGMIVSRMADVLFGDGYGLRLEAGKVQVLLVKRWLDDAIRVETERSLPAGEWHHVLMTYDGSRTAAGVRVYIDGRPEKLRVRLDELNQTFKTTEPLRVGAGGGPDGRFRGRLADVRVYDDRLTAEEAELLADPDPVNALVALPPEKCCPAQAHKVRVYFLEHAAPAPLRQAREQVLQLRRERERFYESIPTTMVMEELPAPRPAFVLVRGQYDRPGERVTADVPATLPPLPPGAKHDRLALARWLVSPDNPLTARVAVNRIWEQFFGTGLVKTTEDFGVQGEWPSHPELLDYLALDFVRGGWDVRALQRRIVTSAAYRQSSKVTPALVQKDPDNRLLARGPRYRLTAGVIRDQALAASGLLVERLGGPSVKSYQPGGLWKELADVVYVQDHGPALYRRSLYTFWKRTVAPPEMVTFDAAGRETCVVRQTRTNTPLQALTLMNDVTFVEAARVLAQRVLREGGTTPEGRLTLAFRLATGRPPRPAELGVLVAGLARHLDEYRRDPAAARKLISAGEAPRDERLDVGKLAAYTAEASLILNLDEVVTKE
jgi:hypothetical protein